jgi:hypothetical protein
VYGYQVAFDALRNGIDGVSYAIGDAVGELFSFETPLNNIRDAVGALGRGLSQVFRNVVADIAAAIAKALILKGLMAAFSGATGGVGGFIGGALGLLGGAGKTGAGGLALNLNVQAGEMRMGNGYLLASVRAALEEERRTGGGSGTL